MWEEIISTILFVACCYGVYRYAKYKKANRVRGSSVGSKSSRNIKRK